MNYRLSTDERLRMLTYVFSFNRGESLRNCINSLNSCSPGSSVVIVDDDSDDSTTLSVLSKLARECRLIRMDKGSIREHKTGGLYANMNFAMADARQRGAELVTFIQDDMQFVRRLSGDDAAWIDAYFSHNRNSIQVSTNFVRRLSEPGFLAQHLIDSSKNAYLRKREFERGKTNFSATGVFHVERFHSVFKRFEVGEHVNSAKARSLNLVCGRAVYPFMNWTPYPISFRGNKRRFVHNLYERLGGAGYHPINLMTEEETQAFLSRDPSILPIMEDFLSSPSAPRHDIWSTGGGEYNMMARGGFPALVFSALRRSKHALTGKKV